MLIKTHRHTKKDLEAYKDYTEIDRANKYSQKKVELSMVIMENFLKQNNKSCVMVSWGKDSVVMLDLFCKIKIDRPVIYMRFIDRANPDCDEVRDKFLKINKITYFEELYNYSEVRKGDKHWKDLFKKYGKRCSGIRNDESKIRLLQWKMNGFASENSCRPLALWNSKEIFSYIEQNNLPLNPVYGYLGGGRYDRKQIRTHSLYGTTGDGMGRKEWEKEYYSDILNKIAKEEFDREHK
jgi:phosphoadenosine phosphosulfate reductase